MLMIPGKDLLYLDTENNCYIRVAEVDPVQPIYFSFKLSLENKILEWPSGEQTFEYFESISNHLELIEEEPFFIDKPQDHLSEVQKSHLERNRAAMNSLTRNEEDIYFPDIYYKGKRYRIIKEWLALNRDFGKTKVYELLGKWLSGGRYDGLLIPAYEKCGLPGTEKKLGETKLGRPRKKEGLDEKTLTKHDKENFHSAYKKFFDGNPANGIKSAYNEMLEVYYFRKKKFPSYSQFYHYVNTREDIENTLRKRNGNGDFDRNTRTLPGSARNGRFGAGSEMQVDSTKDNTHAISIKFVHQYIGRCTLYLVVDVFSGMITGVSLTPDNASYYALCLAIYNVGCDKVDFLNWLGLPGYAYEDWPCDKQPHTYMADRGEALGYMPESLPTNLKITIKNAPSKRPDLKPIIERAIETILDNLASVLHNHGLVVPGRNPRVSTDTRKQAVLNYKQILKLVVLEIIDYNNYHVIKDYPATPEMEMEKIPMRPRDIWNFSRRKGLGSLRRFSKEVLWRNVLPVKKQVSFDREGIKFQPGKKWVPTTPEGKDIWDKIVLTKSKGDFVNIAYNPIDTEETFLLHNKEFYPLREKHGVMPDTFFEFWESERRKKSRNNIHMKTETQENSKKRKAQKAIRDDAKKEVKKRRGRDAVTIPDAREKRQEEAAYSRQEQKDMRGHTAVPETRSEVSSDQQQPILKNRLEIYKSLRDKSS